MITVEKHDFACCRVTGTKIRLVCELVGRGNARCQIRRYQNSKGDRGREQAGGDTRGVLGTGHCENEFRVGGRGRLVGEGMDVNGVDRETPCLHLLSDLLGVGRGENADFVDVLESIREMGEESGNSVRQTHGGARTRGPSRG